MKAPILTAVFSLILIIAKAQLVPGQPAEPTIALSDNIGSSPMVAVLSLKLTNIENQYTASITHSKIINTTKNIANTKSNPWKENDFVCFVLNDQSIIVDTLLIKQPLKIRYEYPSDNGTLNAKIVDLKETEILLQFPFNTKIKYLRIALVEANKKIKTINTIMVKTGK